MEKVEKLRAFINYKTQVGKWRYEVVLNYGGWNSALVIWDATLQESYKSFGSMTDFFVVFYEEKTSKYKLCYAEGFEIDEVVDLFDIMKKIGKKVRN